MHAPSMPAVSALFSGPVSVGLLAGVVSGLFYLVVAGIRWAGRLGAPTGQRQQLRQLHRRSEEAFGAVGDFDAPDRAREVKQQSEEWLYRQVQRRLHPAPSASSLCCTDNGVGMESEAVRVREFIERLVESLVSGELDNVCIKRLHSDPDYDRMFACHHAILCEALARLSFSLQMAIANKPMAGEDSPSAAHAALKQIVHQIIQEAMTLPKFKGVKPTEDEMKSLEDMESKTYEDILATAILNKVIERYQQRDSAGRAAIDGNCNLLSPELMSLVAMHQPQLPRYSETGVNTPRSIDECRHFSYECDTLCEMRNTDPLSVTIEECIEEVTTFSNGEDDDTDSYLPGLDIFKNRRAPFPEYGRDIIDGPPLTSSDAEEDEDDDVQSEDEASMQPTDIINPVDSWEENWLFQKRRLKVGGVAQPMPVPMLVPNPSEDYRALIGDRDAEEVSDLSDCSDGVLEDLVLAGGDANSDPAHFEESVPTNNILGNKLADSDNKNHVRLSSEVVTHKKSKEVTNAFGSSVREFEQSADNKPITYEVREVTEAKNMEYLKTASDDCLSEFGQQEGEYTEDYATVTQRQMDSLTAMSDPDAADIPQLPSTPVPNFSSEISAMDESIVAILEGLVPGESDTDHSSSALGFVELAKPPQPGTIAEREHKKWETAPPIPNNPYSPENIIKRLKNRQPYIRTSSNSDTSVEFPETNETENAEKIVEQPLQVICSPSSVDSRKYGRDYYINAQSITNDKKNQSNNASPEQQGLQEKPEAVLAGIPNKESRREESYLSDHQDLNNIETKVALWQKEINEADQYYKNILNRKQEGVEDTLSNDNDSKLESLLENSVHSNGHKCMTNVDHHLKPKNKNKLREKLKKFEKMEKNGIDTNEENSASEKKSKVYFKTKRTDSSSEIYCELQRNSNMGSNLSLENGNDIFVNEYARSDSPSGSSIMTSDSDYSMPSVRELTKRFSGLVDSDSSTSSPKSVSPAPQGRKKEPWQKKMDDTRVESHGVIQLNTPRPVREIHSLTARSISREFREELRHNHPVSLNKNIYKQINPKYLSGMNNDIVEENPTTENSNISSIPKSPAVCRSMKSNIAFWEQMQNNKSE